MLQMPVQKEIALFIIKTMPMLFIIYFLFMKTPVKNLIVFIKGCFIRFMLIGEDTIPLKDRTQYLSSYLLMMSPVAFVLDYINAWFKANGQFAFFVCMALLINMAVGAGKHLYKKTFNYIKFFTKNIQMGLMLIVTYIMLEMLRLTAGDNIAGEVFKIVIQIVSLLYPTSKVLKNVYILTAGKHPPEFIMTRLYNFEKSGELKDLFNNKKEEEE